MKIFYCQEHILEIKDRKLAIPHHIESSNASHGSGKWHVRCWSIHREMKFPGIRQEWSGPFVRQPPRARYRRISQLSLSAKRLHYRAAAASFHLRWYDMRCAPSKNANPVMQNRGGSFVMSANSIWRRSPSVAAYYVSYQNRAANKWKGARNASSSFHTQREMLFRLRGLSNNIIIFLLTLSLAGIYYCESCCCCCGWKDGRPFLSNVSEGHPSTLCLY